MQAINRVLIGLSLVLLWASSAWATGVLTPAAGGTGGSFIPYTAFPTSPSLHEVVLIVDDSAASACDSAAGSAATLCRWNGATWVALGGSVAEADTLATVTGRGNTSTGNDEANPFEIFGSGGQIGQGWRLGITTAGAFFIDCFNVTQNNCDYYRQLNAGKKFGVKDSSGNILFEVDEATGATTAQVTWDLDLVAVNPADGVATHIWNKDPLSTACTPLAVAGTNRTTGYCTFTDADGDQGVQISRQLPSRMLGILDADVWWKTTGTGNARFQFQTKCYADDEADDAAFNTASVVTAAAGTSGRPNKQAITAITMTGCAAGELLRIRFFRNRTEASDSLTAALDVEKVVFRLR